jgi:hypothetical protein
MAWTKDIPVLTAIADLLLLHLRVERLTLVKKLHIAEAQLAAAGGDAKRIREVRHLLQSINLESKVDDFVPRGPVRPPEQWLAVKTNGSF